MFSSFARNAVRLHPVVFYIRHDLVRGIGYPGAVVIYLGRMYRQKNMSSSRSLWISGQDRQLHLILALKVVPPLRMTLIRTAPVI
jgi:hypothetical protein